MITLFEKLLDRTQEISPTAHVLCVRHASRRGPISPEKGLKFALKPFEGGRMGCLGPGRSPTQIVYSKIQFKLRLHRSAHSANKQNSRGGCRGWAPTLLHLRCAKASKLFKISNCSRSCNLRSHTSSLLISSRFSLTLVLSFPYWFEAWRILIVLRKKSVKHYSNLILLDEYKICD